MVSNTTAVEVVVWLMFEKLVVCAWRSPEMLLDPANLALAHRLAGWRTGVPRGGQALGAP